MLFSMVLIKREHKPMEYELNLVIFCTEDYNMTHLTICIIVIYMSFFSSSVVIYVEELVMNSSHNVSFVTNKQKKTFCLLQS